VTRQLRAILRLAAEQRGMYAAGSIFFFVGIGSGLAYPLYVRRLVDHGVMAGESETLRATGFVLLALLLAEGVSAFMRDYFFNLAGERVSLRVRQTVFEHLLAQDIPFFDRQKTGMLTARMSADAAGIPLLTGEPAAGGLRAAVFAVGGSALLLYTSPTLTLIVMLAVPPTIWVSSVFGRRIRKHTSEMQAAYADAGATAEESIAGVRTVRAFSQEAAEAGRYRARLDDALARARHKIIATGALSGLSFTLGDGAVLLGLWAGGALIVRHQLTAGQLISFVLYAFLVSKNSYYAAVYWSSASRELGVTSWLFELLDRRPVPPPSGSLRPEIAGAIALENVTFRYPTRPHVDALAGVSLDVAPCEVVALVGQSGAGKSTIVNLLLRFYAPSSGRMFVDGHNLDDLDAVWLRRRIGVVMQEPVLFAGTIADNIRYGRADASDAEVADAATLANAREFIDRLPQGMATPIGERGVQLSGGQRQRLAIARAILRRPAILVLDEATSALDAENESFVQDALRALEYRPTTFVIAHRLSSVVSVDRVIVLERGRIVAVGRHEELLRTSTFYRRLVETQLVPA